METAAAQQEAFNLKSTGVSRKRAFFMYFLVSFFLFYEMAVQVSPSVMASQLMSVLQIGALGLGFMSGCYFYTYTLMQIPSGLLFDRFSPKLIIFTSVLVCALGNLLLALSSHFYFACLARLFMGLGSAFAFVSVLVITKDLFSNRYFAFMTGMTQALAALGAMSGQLPISLLMTAVGWRFTLILLSIIGAVLAVAIFILLNYKVEKPVQTTNKTTQYLALKKVIKNKQTWIVALYALLMWSPMAGFTSLWGVPFLQHCYHFSRDKAAFLCSLMWLGLATASPLLGYVSTRLANRQKPLIFSALYGALAFMALLYFHLNTFWLAIALFLAGAACSGQALTFSVVKENNAENILATAIGLNNMAVVISGAIFQPFIGWLLQHMGNIIHSKTEHFSLALTVLALSYIFSFLVARYWLKDPLKTTGIQSFAADQT